MTGGATGAAGQGAGSWLAVIDMQHVFADPGSGWFTPRFGEIVGRVANLVEAFRPRVTFTRFVAPRSPQGAWRRYYEQWPFALQPPSAGIYQLVEPFADEPGPTLDTPTFGKWGLELAASAGAGPLVLAGVSTDCCVLSTAVAAADAGVAVQVAADACAGADDDSHAKALDILRLYGPLIEVVTVADVLAARPAGQARALPGKAGSARGPPPGERWVPAPHQNARVRASAS